MILIMALISVNNFLSVDGLREACDNKQSSQKHCSKDEEDEMGVQGEPDCPRGLRQRGREDTSGKQWSNGPVIMKERYYKCLRFQATF